MPVRPYQFQSTRPIRGATRPNCTQSRSLADFNPRAPYGARPQVRELWRGHHGFQSTRPIRGATGQGRHLTVGQDISIHAPHTGRDVTSRNQGNLVLDFNPRAPYGARPVKGHMISVQYRFQSTRPIRGATEQGAPPHPYSGFQSTRPIRGATCCYRWVRYYRRNFNPRAPYGARQD